MKYNLESMKYNLGWQISQNYKKNVIKMYENLGVIKVKDSENYLPTIVITIGLIAIMRLLAMYQNI